MQKVYSAVQESGAALQSGQFSQIVILYHNKYLSQENWAQRYSRNLEMALDLFLRGAGLTVLSRALRLSR